MSKKGRNEVLPIHSLSTGLMGSFPRGILARVWTTPFPASHSLMWLPVMQEARGETYVLSKFKSLSLLSVFLAQLYLIFAWALIGSL